VLDLSATSASTSNSLAAGAFAGARGVVRAHVTLGSLTKMFSSPLTGNNNVALADGVQLFLSGALHLYFVRGDGITWRESGKAVDETGRVISPDTSFILVLRSGPRVWDHAGLVRSNDFRVKVGAGSQSFASGYPVDLSPLQVSAFADPGLAPSLRWVGNDSVAAADQMQIFNPGIGAFDTYYLRADGVTWHRSGDVADLPQSATIVGATSMVVLSRANPDPGYIILDPASP
jgi:hypothetical protein